MEMLGRIRRMYLRDEVSLHEITKRTGLSRNTVRRWLRTPQEVQVPTYSRAAGFGKPGGFIAELEQSLKADALRARQNRRTGRALFAQIKASGYAGGYGAVVESHGSQALREFRSIAHSGRQWWQQRNSAHARGSTNCRLDFAIASGSPSPCATIPQAHPSGTPSSIACSARSARTGRANHWRAMTP